jgi:hypothetical protein
MKSKRIVIIGVILGAIVVVSLLLIPASKVLSDSLDKSKRVSFSAIKGYWWQGKVSDITVDYRGYRVYVGDLHWQYDWSSFLSTRWCLQGENSASKDLISGHFRLCYLPLEHRVQIMDSAVAVDAKILAQVSGIEIQGQWLINISSAIVENSRLLDIYGEAVWARARWHNGESWFALGEILSTFDASQSTGFEVNTTDIDGPLQVELTTTFSAQQEWAMIGFIEPYSTLPPSLIESLELLSSRAMGRRYYFDYQWR